MSNPLSVFISVVALIQLLYLRRNYNSDIISQTHGRTAGFLISRIFGNTASEYERLQRVVLHGSDEESLRFRDSVTNECNMTAVAGAIIAQVALTALSLADLSLAHWTARAFLLFATVAGCLSVYYACSLSRDVGKLYQPDLIRDWLSAAPETMPEQPGQGAENERKASISAMFILSAPYTMMSYAIIAFIVGLAIYQGFVWTRNLDTAAGKINSRNVFIAYMVSTGFGGLFFSFAGVVKAMEDLLLQEHSFGTSLIQSVRNRDQVDRHRDDEPSSELEGYPLATSAKIAAATSKTIHTASQSQDTADESSSTGIVAALEAAAKAHILSAEADQRVAVEYGKLSKG